MVTINADFYTSLKEEIIIFHFVLRSWYAFTERWKFNEENVSLKVE